MLSAEAAGLVMSIAEGLIKLSGRLDLLLAEKEATSGPLVLPMRKIDLPRVPHAVQVKRLQDFLAKTADADPDPLGGDRRALTALLKSDSDSDEVGKHFARLFPNEAGFSTIDPDTEFVTALRTFLPGVDVDNPETRLAAFYVTAGRDEREIGYAGRIALLVADCVGEVGTQNAARLIRDPQLRGIAVSIVGRLAEPDLDTFTAWSPLLRHTLAATLDGLLENRGALESAAPWVDALVSALAMARAEAASGEDFVTGLVRGQGYRVLIGKGLLVAGDRLAPDSAGPYREIAADILRAAAPLATKESASFRTFFNDNWGELLRAGLASVDRHGPALLEGTKPVVREASIALIAELARAPAPIALTGETLYRFADAVIGTVARNPALLEADVKDAWFREVVTAATKAVSDQGLKKAFTRDGLRRVATEAIAVLVEHPDLLADKPSRQLMLVTTVVKAASAAGSTDATTLATAAITAVLQRLGEEPELLGTRYADLLSALCGQLAKLVAARTLTGVQAADVIAAAAEAVLRNPALFMRFEGNLASAVVTGVLKGASSSELKLIGGKMLVELLGEVLRVVAQRGRELVETTPEKELIQRISDTISAGLDRADLELGHRVDKSRLPWVLAQLVVAVARGDPAAIDPENPNFQQTFARLAELAA